MGKSLNPTDITVVRPGGVRPMHDESNRPGMHDNNDYNDGGKADSYNNDNAYADDND